MSNLAAAARLRQPVSQFPSHWYSDPRVFDAEMRTLFPRAPGYAGHELMVPETGDYQVLPGRHDPQAPVRHAGGVDDKGEDGRQPIQGDDDVAAPRAEGVGRPGQGEQACAEVLFERRDV